MEEKRDINRLKVVLAEKKRTNKWLAEQLGKDQATVSKWCTNASQPQNSRNIRSRYERLVMAIKINFLFH